MSELGIEPRRYHSSHSDYAIRMNSSSGRPDCHCCPYGYHIDLGFVDFCKKVEKQNAEPSPVKIERRERRRERRSMDVLLGLANPMFLTPHQFLPSEASPDLHSGLDTLVAVSSSSSEETDGLIRAVEDFEATLQRTSQKRPDLFTVIEYSKEPEYYHEGKPGRDRAPISLAVSSSANETIHDSSICSEDPMCGSFETPSLKSIREQMAKSLEKMREMEEKMKSLPRLKKINANLEETKSSLLSKIAELTHTLSMKNQQIGELNQKLNHEKKAVVRDVATLCVPLTRDIEISKYPDMRSASTETKVIRTVNCGTAMNFDDYPSVDEQPRRISLKDLDSSRNIQETKKTAETQTLIVPAVKKIATMRDIAVQCESEKLKSVRDIGITARPKTQDFGGQKIVTLRSIGVSDDTTTSLNCERCTRTRRSVGVGYGNVNIKEAIVSPVNRSKSFDLSTKKQTRSIGVCTPPPIKKLTATKQVATIDFTPLKKNAAVNTDVCSKRDASTTAKIEVKPVKPADVVCDFRSNDEDKENLKIIEKKEVVNYDKQDVGKEKGQVSKIPRPFGNQTADKDRRKTFVRQNTYSKTLPIGSASPDNFGLSSSPKKSDLSEDQVEVTLRKKNKHPEDQAIAEIENSISQDLRIAEKRASVASTSGGDRYSALFEDGAYDYDEQYGGQESNRNSQMFPDNALFQPIQETLREKLAPSKEMKAAMKVVNDGLYKYPNGLPKHLKNAQSIIQQEWFQISSTASANPLDVEDYLDSFEEVSNFLLECVVNMVDNNGNTAMHYAVSHGNFDVVSILLDSRVCNINKPNAAGYTCVMLVSLAEVRSHTHREVVRRLFLLADVNVRAVQHGQTALMLAVSHGRLDMVKLLLEAGADPNIQDWDGSTALMCAAEHGHLEIAKQILADQDCDPSIVDCDGTSALAIAMEAGNRDIGVLLYAREHFAPNSRGNSPYTSIKHKKNRSASSPQQKTPPSPGPGKKCE